MSGRVATNLRQGVRAEHLARHILSEFGPCIKVPQEEDFGIDLICSLMEIEGSVGYVKSVFGVQVKSGNEPFLFKGERVFEWLQNLNLPLFCARVNREDASLRLYSCWTLPLLLNWNTERFVNDTVRLLAEDDLATPLADPEKTADATIVHMGKPIIEIDVSRLADASLKDEVFRVLDEWVTLEVDNCSSRLVGLPLVFGYRTWTTNASLNTSMRVSHHLHLFGGENLLKAAKVFLKAATVINSSLPSGPDGDTLGKFNAYAKENGLEMPCWLKGASAD